MSLTIELNDLVIVIFAIYPSQTVADLYIIRSQTIPAASLISINTVQTDVTVQPSYILKILFKNIYGKYI